MFSAKIQIRKAKNFVLQHLYLNFRAKNQILKEVFWQQLARKFKCNSEKRDFWFSEFEFSCQKSNISSAISVTFGAKIQMQCCKIRLLKDFGVHNKSCLTLP